MALSQHLVQKQTQRLVITQDLRQSIELLPLSNLELSEKIEQELLENPMLESASDSGDPAGDDPIAGEDAPQNENTTSAQDTRAERGETEADLEWWRESSGSADSAERSDRKQQFLENTLTSAESLGDHLIQQLRLTDVTEEELAVGEIIISAIDNHGFLIEKLEDLFDTPEAVEQARDVLDQIQNLDPIGCGARDIPETLLLQASILRPGDSVTQLILRDHFVDLEKLNYKRIEKESGFSREEIEDALKFIRTLEPYPGTLYSARRPDYVVPDIIVMEVGGKLEVLINDEWMPRLSINQDYSELIKGESNVPDADREFLQQRLNSAVWLLKSIRQRRQTLYRVTRCIADLQEDFFRLGPGHLKPLTLREVAELVELHESTVSRITTNKYAQTRWGVHELKYFFSSSVGSTEGSEDRHSARTIQERIRNLVDGEDPDAPLSDQAIVSALESEGVQIARRTVAKYRGVLNILPADRRKKLKKLK